MVQHSSFSKYLYSLIHGSRANRGIAALILFVFCPFSLIIVRAILVRIGLRFATDSIISFIWGFCIVFSLSALKNKIKFSDLLFIIVISALYIISGFVHPDTREFLDANRDIFFSSCLPLYFLGLSLDYNKHRDSLYWCSVLSIFINVLFVYFISNELVQGSMTNDNMAWSYALLLPVLIVLLYNFEKSDILGIATSIIGTFLLLSLGTRGPVLCLVFFIAGYFLFFKTFKHNFIGKTFIMIVGSIIYIFINPICLFLMGVASSLGLSNRVFESIITDTFANYQESNARNEIYEGLLEYVKDDPTGFGYGLMGDRFLTADNSYSHNLEIEILVSFGKIGGFIVLLLLLVFIIKSFKKTKGNASSLIIFVLFCSSVLQLQFSNSFLSCAFLYLYLGYAVSSLRQSKQQFINET